MKGVGCQTRGVTSICWLNASNYFLSKMCINTIYAMIIPVDGTVHTDKRIINIYSISGSSSVRV